MTYAPIEYMRQALGISEKGRLTAYPNPTVGCILVKNNIIVGSGFHEMPGAPHAEIHAINEAGQHASGSTAFVTLEPCCHYGRTGPCVKALIEAKISHVYVAIEDPDTRVSGKGIKALREAGIKVDVGLGSDLIQKSLRAYLHHRKTTKPYCVLKAALSLDGKIAAADRSSQWITSEEARRDAHFLRAQSQAIMIGSETAIKDKPRLTVRNIELPKGFLQPMRVLLDGRGRVNPLDLDFEIVFTSQEDNKDEWLKKGTEVHILRDLDLKKILSVLGRKNIVQLLVEGGAKLQASFIKEKLFNELVLYYGSCWLGDNGIPFSTGVDVKSINESIKLKLIELKKFENDFRADYICLQE